MSNPLSELSKAIRSAVRAAAPSVVRVEAGRWSGSTGVVWSADGQIITAAHTLKRSDVHITLAGGREVAAAVVGRDPATDLALLKAEATDLDAPDWDEGELEVGQVVLALGWPGKAVRATMGILSNLGGEWRTPAGGRLERYIQPDLTLYPGFSGGPLISGEGRFLGLNTRGLRRDVALTLPPATLRRVVERLQKHGSAGRPYLGISAQPVRLPEGQGQPSGLMVVGLEPAAPAARAGLLMGDILLRLDTAALHRMEDLLSALSEHAAGTQVHFALLRGGKAQEVAVTLGERE
ncbi:MAG: S1C family serine protease [Meiothermus sp.]|nr:S1C family serine protease [Meiothermus sp.]